MYTKYIKAVVSTNHTFSTTLYKKLVKSYTLKQI